uniref:Uncharacterized protein n=1 Tax=Myotis myotis TaxID=51298 RepID=A0A7J7T696_MYOMY|nr:hypothetical protein mMyoMyo1_009240 [Myotis myotis]
MYHFRHRAPRCRTPGWDCNLWVKVLLRPVHPTNISCKICTSETFLYSSHRFGSVARASACARKGLRFDSGQGHMPGLQARSPVGGMQEAANQFSLIIDVYISPFSFLSEINYIYKISLKETFPYVVARRAAHPSSLPPPPPLRSGSWPQSIPLVLAQS